LATLYRLQWQTCGTAFKLPGACAINQIMAKAAKKRVREKRYVWRDARTGEFLDVIVADPPVKPRRVSVQKIREAVRRSDSPAVRKDE
jgi:hypothetical protein